MFSLWVQDEKQKKIGAGKKLQVDSATLVALTTKNNLAKDFAKGKSGRPQCTHCGVLGHVVDKCYKLHGYPLVISSNPRVNKLVLLLTMLLLLKITQICKSHSCRILAIAWSVEFSWSLWYSSTT